MNQAFQALWTSIFVLALFVLCLASAKSNGLVVFTGSAVDLTAVLLTAASVVVTGIGVFVAILALWGYKEIRDRAIDQAVGTAVEKAVEAARAAARDAAKPVAARAAMEYLKSQKDSDAALSDDQVNDIVKAVSTGGE